MWECMMYDVGMYDVGMYDLIMGDLNLFRTLTYRIQAKNIKIDLTIQITI